MTEIDINPIVDKLLEIDPTCKSEVSRIEYEHNCSIDLYIEKHNVLQYTYFYEISFENDKTLYVEIESGINNGTRLNNCDWDCNTKQNTKTIEVLKDIILDTSFYEDGTLLKRKAQAILDVNKNKLFKFYRQNNYDNYVTGGNSKLKLDSLLSKLKLEYIYEEKEVDCNFI